ncbi:MAG: glycerol-3-phosphate 1-O-acyltransferase PlsY [Proteobacteria bacterium]|nr:glycerol-3-phosphate 1-O-acyltransferase PlsY [Pseudomonadota bacterium]
MPEAFSTLSELQLYAAAIGYFLGSIPFGLLLARAAGIGDIRSVGSGNVGATNVLRTGKKGIAALTMILDAAKGSAAVGIALALGWGPEAAIWAALFAVIGHDFPVWLKFKGGKGVATTLGVALVLSWPVALLSLLVWILVVATLRISSAAALLALAAAPVLGIWMADPNMVALMLLLAVLGYVRHHQNIARLLRGEESRFGSSKTS